MGKAYPMEVRLKAQELFCVLRWTLKAVAEEIGVTYTTVQRWSQMYGWQEMQDNLAQAEFDIRANTVLARSEMLTTLINTKDPQAAFAVSSLETLAMKKAEAERAGQLIKNQLEQPERKITSLADAIPVLEQAINIKLARLLDDPDADMLRAARNIKSAFEFIDALKPKDDKKKKRGLTAETAEEIRKQILFGDS
ncbi:terminase gpP N-terminus-related DNA-binding protein [Maridesulfovibrio sp.]|uniref:terminase gpP N-terminus-related DNA-binding protein n=1 Tax=Maridesulfovibrio sp. TaxID=2795000 RepID=UPI0039F0F590